MKCTTNVSNKKMKIAEQVISDDDTDVEARDKIAQEPYAV